MTMSPSVGGRFNTHQKAIGRLESKMIPGIRRFRALMRTAEKVSQIAFEPTFRSWGGCEYMRGNRREGGAGHINKVICPSRLKPRSAQQIRPQRRIQQQNLG